MITATTCSLLTFNEDNLPPKMLYMNPMLGVIISIISPYVQKESSAELRELGNSTLCRQPLVESMFSCGREMAFLMMGEMSGGGDDKSLELSCCRCPELLRT